MGDLKKTGLALATGGASLAFDAAGNAIGNPLEGPSLPQISRPPEDDPEERRKLAEEAARKRQQRARGGFGFSDTFLTGGAGLGPVPDALKLAANLIGG